MRENEYTIKGIGKDVYEKEGKYFLRMEMAYLAKNKKQILILEDLKNNGFPIIKEDYDKFKSETEKGNYINLEGKIKLEEIPL